MTDWYVGYLGEGALAVEHAHHAVQLIWSFGRPVDVIIDGLAKPTRATIIPSQCLHAFEATSDPLLLLLVEPHSRRGRALGAVAERFDGSDPTSFWPGPTTMPVSPDANRFERWCTEFVESLVDDREQFGGRTGRAPRFLRPEISAALGYIDHNLHGTPRLADAAALVGLSQSRLTHLFTAEIGMPFRRFVLWRRIRRATEEVQLGQNLTAASASAGFADSAHFSRVFFDMFGLSPSAVLAHLEIVSAVDGSA